jgi:hypothetical protein
VAIRRPSLAGGRDPLLVVGVLTMMLGLGTVGSGLVGPEPFPEEAAEAMYPPARTDLPGTAASPLAVGDRVSSGSTCHSGHPHASRPGTAVLASIDDDPREYLSKMAAMRYRHRVATATTPDPYQASLNPAVYLAGDTTPIAHDGSPTRVPHNQLCRSP